MEWRLTKHRKGFTLGGMESAGAPDRQVVHKEKRHFKHNFSFREDVSPQGREIHKKGISRAR